MGERPLLRAALLLLALAAALTAYVTVAGVPIPGDVRLTRAIQERGQFDSTARVINAAGSWNAIPFAMAVLAVAFSSKLRWAPALRPAALRGTLAAFAAAVVLRGGSDLLKRLLESPRPAEALGVDVEGRFGGYGFPSGHVYGDVLFYGLIAVFAPAWLPPRLVWPVRALSLAIIILAGPARVSVGAHWPSDTVGGYLWGAIALCLALAAGAWAGARPQKHRV
jgi:undecaprenyl-diphosphatase